MTDSAERLPAASLATEAARRLAAAAGALERARPSRVLAAMVVVQWLTVLGFALTVRHNGWIYYQGGDQLWYYTTAWLFAHGHVGVAGVGYLWSALLAPIAAVTGPDVAAALPAIIIVNVAIFVPLTTVALWGIAERLAGRLFAYWAAAIWIALPFLGIAYTSPGYHQRFTELFLPGATGLTGLADLPSTAAVVISCYFVTRLVLDEAPNWTTAVAAGVSGGAAVAIKPSAALFLPAAALALLATRRFRLTGIGVASLIPALVTMAIWKWRGNGSLPIGHAYDGTRLAAGSAVPDLPSGLAGMDWHHISQQLDYIHEYFWSVRPIEWVVFAGVIALARKSPRGALLVGAWFWAFILGKITLSDASLADASLLRLLVPAAPAFALLVASLPLLVPGVARRCTVTRTPNVPSPPGRRAALALAAALAGTAVVPMVAVAALPRQSGRLAVTLSNVTPLPNDIDVGLRAQRSPDGTVRLTWRDQTPPGSRVFYHVFRAQQGASDFTCYQYVIPRCLIAMPDLGTTKGTSFVDRPGPGTWHYRVGVAANWLDDPRYGDVYELSPALAVGPGGG